MGHFFCLPRHRLVVRVHNGWEHGGVTYREQLLQAVRRSDGIVLKEPNAMALGEEKAISMDIAQAAIAYSFDSDVDFFADDVNGASNCFGSPGPGAHYEEGLGAHCLIEDTPQERVQAHRVVSRQNDRLHVRERGWLRL